MTIDIKPDITRQANDIEKIVMDTYGFKELYYMETTAGEEFSTKWNTTKEGEWTLEKFCPNKTVSEMKASWERGIKDEKLRYEKAITTGEHPYWTSQQEVEGVNPWDKKSFITVPYKMSKREIQGFKDLLQRHNERYYLGKDFNSFLKFVRVVRHIPSKEVNFEGLTAQQFVKSLNAELRGRGLQGHFKYTEKEIRENGMWQGEGRYEGAYRTPEQIAKDLEVNLKRAYEVD